MSSPVAVRWAGWALALPQPVLLLRPSLGASTGQGVMATAQEPTMGQGEGHFSARRCPPRLQTPHRSTADVGACSPQARVPPAGSVGSASSPACRCHPRCAHCAACPSTPRRWTRLPTWRSSSHPTRRPAEAAVRRYWLGSRRVCRGTGRRPPPGPVEQPAAPLTSRVWPGLWAVADAGMGAELSPP